MDAQETTRVIVRFAGDSGDGMQLLGSSWVNSCAQSHNDLATVPDFPAEIRAPAGTLAGVSGFQIQFASEKVFTAGDQPNVLVALNPAALKGNVSELKKGGTIIVNSSAFGDLALKKAGYELNPLEDNSLQDFQLIKIDMSQILRHALKDSGLGAKDIQKCKNFFCLGLLYWLYSRNPETEINFIKEKFKKNELLVNANICAFNSGYAYGENTESLLQKQIVPEANLEPGTYRTITGNKALALGLITAGVKANLKIFYASYPITPASDILHEVSLLRAFNSYTFQAEDEIAAICAAIGASYGGSLGVTATSGPGLALKTEALGYASMIELPLVVINVQRAGPSTGMPTKTEQSDLMQAMFGRSGEAPLPIIAPLSPPDCFDAAIEATRIAINFMTPVIILSDAMLANGASPWQLKDPDLIPNILVHHEPHRQPFKPYERSPEYLSRAWIVPGEKNTIHQLGGLEKDFLSGKVSYDPKNHQQMTDIRQRKIERIKNFVEPPKICGENQGDVLVIGFGSTFGAIRQATKDLIEKSYKVSHLHLRLLNPLHDQIGIIAKSFKKVLVVENNQGQLKKLLRSKFLINAQGLNKTSGKAFLVSEVRKHIEGMLEKPKHISISKEARL